MEFLEFPKFFRELSAEQLGETLRDIGFDGVDVMVRDGYWVTYDTLRDSLPAYLKTMHSFGLSTRSATTGLTCHGECLGLKSLVICSVKMRGWKHPCGQAVWRSSG